jgi:hypothetical protein
MPKLVCVSYLCVSYLAATQALPGRRLSYDRIAGYAPGSDVTEHNSIDKDQLAMENALKEYDFVTAKKWYTAGGNSVSKGKFRTLQGFSTGAKAKMYDCKIGCPYFDYSMYYKYYGDFDYADKWVIAALDGKSTGFAGNFNQDFDVASDDGKDLRVEAAKKGSAYLNVYMYVIREFEDAIDDCKRGCIECNDAPVHAWDEGVAFYTGSLEGTDGRDNGKLLHALADKRCMNFKTCGYEGNKLIGTSFVNYELGRLFALGQHHLVVGDCDKARVVKEQIVNFMAVPMIQGTLRYAYKMDKLGGGTSNKENGEGVTFAAAILPKVAYCDPEAAEKIAANMRVGATPDFATVKSNFESVYDCMNLTCSDIGGMWFAGEEGYYEGASPCLTFRVTMPIEGIVGIAAACLVALLACAFICILIRREKKGKPIFYSLDKGAASTKPGSS